MEPLILLGFNRRVRRALFETLAALPPEAFREDVGISFGSLRDTLFHVARVEDFWVNAFLREDERRVARTDRDEVATVQDLARLWDRVSDATEAYVADLSPEALAEVRRRSAGAEVVEKTVEEYLFTFLIHEVYHKGEVLAVLWQKDVEPPFVDYWRY